MSITKIQQTTGGVSKYSPQFQIYNDKVYYAWRENYKIYTAISDLDGTNFTTNELISTVNSTRSNPQMQVYNNKIYYIYYEVFVVGTGGWGESIYNHQLFLAITDLDGSNLSINQYRIRLENYGYLIKTPQFYVYESTIYYIWSGSGLANLPSPSNFAQYELWFGTTDLNGNNFSCKQMTFADSVYDPYYEIFTPQFQVYGNIIHYVYSSYYNLCTASSDLDGDNFNFVNRYEEIEQQYPESYSDNSPQIQVYNNKLYYFWGRYTNYGDGLFFAFSNLDGSNFTIKFQVADYYDIRYPQFHVFNNKVYYSWVRYYWDTSFTATSNLDGSNFENNLYTTSSTAFDSPQLQVYMGKVYYVWNSKVSNVNQIWLGFEDVPIPPPVNDASQRTWGKDISVHLNKRIGEKQIIVYSNGTGIFLATMNPDGTEWKPKKIINTIYLVQLADIYNDEIYIYVGGYLYVLDSEGNILSTAEIATGVGSGEFFDFNNSKIYGWTRNSNYYVSINSINFDGTGYETHQITTRTFSTYFYFQRLSNKLVYFYTSSGRLYTATSDLDCSNFIGVDRLIKPAGYGRSLNNGITAYLDFYFYSVEEGFGGFQLGKLDSAGNFSYVLEEVSGDSHFGTFLKGSYLYYITAGGDTDAFIYVAKADLNGNVLFENDYVMVDFFNEIIVDPYDDGNNIFAWQQQQSHNNENIWLLHLWTLPGNGTIEPISVQCQVTDKLIDATTGNIITKI